MKFYVLVVFSALLAYANSQTGKSASEIATQRAEPGPTKNCGTYVRTAIQMSQGKPVVGMGVNAANMGPWLEKNGYTGTSKSYTEAQPDDVAVFPASPGHSDGHAQIYNGKNWVSDWKQNNFYPYKDGSKPAYKIYSPKSSGQGSTGGGSPAGGATGGSRTGGSPAGGNSFNDAGSDGSNYGTYDSTYDTGDSTYGSVYGSDYNDGSDYGSYGYDAGDDSTYYGGSNDGDDDSYDDADSDINYPDADDYSAGPDYSDDADADADDDDGGDYGNDGGDYGGYGGY